MFMKRFFVASIVTAFAATAFLFSGCVGPKKAKTEVKEIHKLGWWTKNSNMTIESFEVKVVESNLSLFNTTSKISYTISGTMKSNAGWEPYIGEVHVLEQYEQADSMKQVSVHRFTPVMHTRKNKKFTGGETKFKFTNEHTVSSYSWGQNRFRFVCGDFVTEIVLHQRK
jgi:hypothetical protein